MEPVAVLTIPILKHSLSSTIPEKLNKNISDALLTWYNQERAHIPVPGRGKQNPYAIWVAEVMLQQTQVATVWPYYERWLAKYPDIETLAAASIDSVLKSWEGLGYYGRARNLHKGARYISSELSGRFPTSAKALEQIPGIGPYTAAALASFAFGEAVPLLDGNVLRVITRLLRIKEDISKTNTKNEVRAELSAIIPKHDPGAFNQSIMDLGRVICKPKAPHCQHCPIQNHCQAFERGDVQTYPVKPEKKVLPHYTIVVGLIKKGPDVLIQRRQEDGLLGGLWEFPGGKVEPGESLEQAVLREIKEETGLDVILEQRITTIKHAYTHFKITLTAFYCQWNGGEAQTHAATRNRWVGIGDLSAYAFPKANLKILEYLSNS